MNLANLSLHGELVNLVLFAACIGKVLLYTGLIAVVPIAAIDTFLLEPKKAKAESEAQRG
jgi:hypothetical protein